MDTRIKTSNFEMTSDVSAYLADKLAAIERLITDSAARCEVEIGRTAGHSHQGNVWKAEIVIMHFGARFRAVAEEESVNAAIDIVKDEIQQQLRKNKGRHETLARRMGSRLKRLTRFGRE